MNANTKNKKLSSEIADLIVQLVDQTDGPVTLAQVERDVPGFAKDGTPNWCYSIVGSGTDYLVWNGMSDQGRLALRKIISERRVAIQHVSALPYLLLDSRVIDDDAWMPTVLLPKKAANLAAPHRLYRFSERTCEAIIAEAVAKGTPGYRALASAPMRFTADQFAP